MRRCLSVLADVLLACTLVTLSSGCASPEKTSAPALVPPPVVKLGPTLDLLKVPPVRDKVRAVAAPDGSVHVLIASTQLKSVTEVVVSPSGDIERRTVRSGVSPWHLDGAFDRQGRFHALVDLEHMIFEDGAWQQSDRTPWRGFESNIERARFVPGAPDLVWLFEVEGRAVGAPGFWVNMGGNVILPWFVHGTRPVFVADLPSGYGPWIVVDPQEKATTRVFDAASDEHGNVFLVYHRDEPSKGTGTFLVTEPSTFFLRLDPELLRGAVSADRQIPDPSQSFAELRAAIGQPIRAEGLVCGGPSAPSKLVPFPYHELSASRTARYSNCISQRPRALILGEPRDPWLGRGGAPVRYVEYSEGQWSSPLEVGLAEVNGFFSISAHAFDIASTTDSRAFVVWPMKHGIVGRWIEDPQ